jgi:hypothetical protein
MMKTLYVDDKWSIVYDDLDNDRPKRWHRYGTYHSSFDENNAVVSMFYSLLGYTYGVNGYD